MKGRGKGRHRWPARRLSPKRAAWMDKDDRALVERMAWRHAFEFAWRVKSPADAEKLAGEAFEAACNEFQKLADMPRWSGAREYFIRVFSDMFGAVEER